MWPRQKHSKKHRPAPTPPSEYPGEPPEAAVGALLGRPVTRAEAEKFLGQRGLAGYRALGTLDPDLPGRLLRRYDNGILYKAGSVALFGDGSVSVKDVLRDHEARPTPTQTSFFREPSLRVFAEVVAGPCQNKAEGRPLQLADIGCSRGKLTWSLAAYLKGNDITAHINGFDINDASLTVARNAGPYRSSPDDANHMATEASRYLAYIQNDGRYLHVDSLRNMADFHQADIGSQPLEGEYDGVSAYNMLWHYPPGTREEMLGNMLSGLRPGGTFMFEGTDGGNDAHIDPAYRGWASDLSRFGLSPHPDVTGNNAWAANSVLIYNPA